MFSSSKPIHSIHSTNHLISNSINDLFTYPSTIQTNYIHNVNDTTYYNHLYSSELDDKSMMDDENIDDLDLNFSSAELEETLNLFSPTSNSIDKTINYNFPINELSTTFPDDIKIKEELNYYSDHPIYNEINKNNLYHIDHPVIKIKNEIYNDQSYVSSSSENDDSLYEFNENKTIDQNKNFLFSPNGYSTFFESTMDPTSTEFFPMNDNKMNNNNNTTNINNDNNNNVITHSTNRFYQPPVIRQLNFKKGKQCCIDGCLRRAQSNSRCKAHGGGARCQIEGCTKSSQGGGFCRTHGGGKRCKMEGCTKGTQRNGLCFFHGGIRKCGFLNCEKKDRGNGFCIGHGGGKKCKIFDCTRLVRKGTLCSTHLEGEILQIPNLNN